MKVVLPVILNPISRRKDKSVKLSFETRELAPDEALALMNLEGSEGWLHFGPNEKASLPTEIAIVDELKSPSERLRNALYRLFLQEKQKNKVIGLFDTYYKDQMEKYIAHTLSKLDL